MHPPASSDTSAIVHDGKGCSCPCGRMIHHFKEGFALPSFPEHYMFVCPFNTFDRASRWYRWLKGRLHAWQKNGSKLQDEFNVIRFPLAMPFEKFLPMGAAVELSRIHNGVCHAVRQSILLAKGEEREAKIEEALAGIEAIFSTFARIQPTRGAEVKSIIQDGSREKVAQLRDAHLQWRRGFEGFLERLLESGDFSWRESTQVGDYRNAPLGYILFGDGECLSSFDHIPAVVALKEAHKRLHGQAFVWAHEASALRSRGLTSAEKKRVGVRFEVIKAKLSDESEKLMALIPATVRSIDNRRRGPCTHALQGSLPAASLEQTVQEIGRFCERVGRFADLLSDMGLERLLPPHGTAVGRRIDAAMSDYGLYTHNAFGFWQLENANHQLHATAIRMVTLARNGAQLEAQAVGETLERDRRNLVDYVVQLADLLGLERTVECAHVKRHAFVA